MRQIALVLAAVAVVAVVAACIAPVPGHAAQEAEPVFVDKVIPGYRDWVLISVAREEGELNDIRAVLGNDVAIKAYREGKPFPEGAVIARIAWSYDASEENNKTFGRAQSYVAGAPKNYAATGGWGYAHFNDGKSAEVALLKACFPCHAAIKERDYVFTRYAP
jgi:hypothetical protein